VVIDEVVVVDVGVGVEEEEEEVFGWLSDSRRFNAANPCPNLGFLFVLSSNGVDAPASVPVPGPPGIEIGKGVVVEG
jgi:hypothetical protein